MGRFSSLPSLSVPEESQIASKSVSTSLGRAETGQLLTSQLRIATGMAERECVNDTGYEACYLDYQLLSVKRRRWMDG